ncbi:GIY-YIG nuclease family protein [Staphylococcus epidermidis]|uniref:GIY-YIG nuclease family protein n=1 Tax=Staphylococcus epidermidis TaxID=1282 RepID=UPI0021B3EB91|nr:GIY-YIG nuclease family protein [Staphylococcus epidermidis]
MVKCNEGSLYRGYGKDVNAGVIKDNKGKGGKYRKIRGGVELVYEERYRRKWEGLKGEYEIKRYSREEKLKMIEEG